MRRDDYEIRTTVTLIHTPSGRQVDSFTENHGIDEGGYWGDIESGMDALYDNNNLNEEDEDEHD